MKLFYYLLPLIFLFSCKDDISNSQYRNENYVFYKENGNLGEWRKIDPELEIKPPKSHSTYFFPNGNRYAELEVLDSFPNRIVKYFNKSDKLTKTNYYKRDSVINSNYEDGYYKSYHSNIGIIKSEGLIDKNLNQGTWKFYYESGNLERAVDYLNDTLHGDRKKYWENGKLKSYLKNVKGKMNGECIHYYENGELQEENYLKNDEFHGSMKQYYESGKIKSIRKYWKGNRIDTCLAFFENGNMKRQTIIEFDTLASKSKGREYKYFKSGELKSEVDFIDFMASGELIIYNKKGVIIERSLKLNDKHHGEFIRYYDSGLKKFEGNLNKGFFHGEIKFYDENEKLLKEINYINGTAKDSIIY